MKSLSLLWVGIVAAFSVSSSFAIPKNDNPSDADHWFDITVLQAHVIEGMTLKDFDHVENCHKSVENRPWSRGYTTIEEFNCDDYIAGRLNATPIRPFPRWQFENGRLDTGLLDLSTPIVEILTVTPDDRLALATHVGFSMSSQGGEINMFRAIGNMGQTREVGKVILKDGRTGIVHRWIAPLMNTGYQDGEKMRSLRFKPVLIRQNYDGANFYWDHFIGSGFGTDYGISNFTYGGRMYRFQAPNYYDRRSELLMNANQDCGRLISRP